MAPILWFALLTFPVWRRRFQFKGSSTKTRPLCLTRTQRRKLTKLVNGYFCTTAPRKRPNYGIQANKLRRSYPLRLRKEHRILTKAPSLDEQESDCFLRQLQTKVLILNREVARLRRRPCQSTATDTVQKGGTARRRKKQVSRKPLCSPQYCPVPVAGSTSPASTEPWTAAQRNTAQRIINHAHLACATTLRMALQAPARMRSALGARANTSPIIWD